MGMEKSNNLGRRAFEIFLLLLGVAIGFIPSYYLEIRKEAKLQQSIVILLRASAKEEISIATRYKNDIERAINEHWDEQIYGEGFKWFHDTSLILSISQNIGYLEPEIVKAFDNYYRALKQCQNMLDISIAIAKSKTKRAKDADSPFKTYVLGLDAVIDHGTKLITAIDKYYPSLKEQK